MRQEGIGKLDRIVSQWMSDMDCMDQSKAVYYRTLLVWNRWMITERHYNVMGATRSDIEAYRDWLIRSGKSPHTICNYLAVVRMFCRYLHRTGAKSEDISSGIRGVKRRKFFNKRPLTDDQVVDLFGCLDLSTKAGIRDRLILSLMVRAGLRCCEVSRIDVGDFITVSGTPALRLQRKGHITKDMTIPVADDVMDALHDYLPVRQPRAGEPLLTSYHRRLHGSVYRINADTVKNIVMRRLRRAGISGDGISAHSLRHTFGCMMVSAGVPLDQVQVLMGHNSIDSTAIYVKMAADRELFANNPANRVKIGRKGL